MEIPNIPTDKFYKFLTISGLIMIFAPIIYLFTMTNDTKSTEEFVLAAQHDIRAHYIKKKIANILERNSSIELRDDTIGIEYGQVKNVNFLSRSHGDIVTTVYYTAYGSDIDSLESKVNELNELAENLAIEEVSFVIKNIYFIDKGKDRQLARILLFSCAIIGSLISLWGFKMWYRIEKARKGSLDHPNANTSTV